MIEQKPNTWDEDQQMSDLGKMEAKKWSLDSGRGEEGFPQMALVLGKGGRRGEERETRAQQKESRVEGLGGEMREQGPSRGPQASLPRTGEGEDSRST